jgi:hypothetical protein
MTVISSAILDSRKKVTKIINHITGEDADFITCLRYVNNGTRAMPISISAIPDKMLASSRAIHNGK